MDTFSLLPLPAGRLHENCYKRTVAVNYYGFYNHGHATPTLHAHIYLPTTRPATGSGTKQRPYLRNMTRTRCLHAAPRFAPRAHTYCTLLLPSLPNTTSRAAQRVRRTGGFACFPHLSSISSGHYPRIRDVWTFELLCDTNRSPSDGWYAPIISLLPAPPSLTRLSLTRHCLRFNLHFAGFNCRHRAARYCPHLGVPSIPLKNSMPAGRTPPLLAEHS